MTRPMGLILMDSGTHKNEMELVETCRIVLSVRVCTRVVTQVGKRGTRRPRQVGESKWDDFLKLSTPNETFVTVINTLLSVNQYID